MSETPKPSEEGKNTANSLLSEILRASPKGAAAKAGDIAIEHPETTGDGEKGKKPREPISIGVFLKLIGALLFISVIFFGSFLAYIAFNPDQAVFFTRTFNIDPNDVQNLLKKLINGSFGFVMVIVSIVWIVALFRAFWTPKELKRKKLLSSLVAALVGVLLFLILAFWAFLFNQVGATDYSNPDGTILIYDNVLYKNEKYSENARIYNTANIIGPIDIFFDIRRNAELLVRENLYTIESFDINFDGAICSNGRSVINGTNPLVEQSTICTFTDIKEYNIVGSYKVRTREGTIKDIPMVLPNIEIRGEVVIKKQKNSRDQKIMTFDASKLKSLGTVRWVFASSGKEVTDATLTEVVTSIPQGLCLKLFENRGCDRIFLMEDKSASSIDGSIEAIQDLTDKRQFRFSLSGVTINPNEILNIEWLLDNQNIICKGETENCDFTFSTYGRKKIEATIELANNEKYTIETEIVVNEPINIIRHIKVVNTLGEILNTDGTYDNGLRAYILKNTIIPPESLTFDARDIVSGNSSYTLKDVLWKISNGKTTEERRGEKIEIEFNQPLRYTIDAIYTFEKSIPGEKPSKESIKETVVVDIERRKLMPRMNITTTSDYVPTLATIDASQSESEDGEIKKFVIDFGEGRIPSEDDSIKQYTYNTPGEKTITLTIVAENGEKASIKKTLVLKDQVKTIDFIPSIQPGIAGNLIDFEANGTSGQIEDYIWNFGDNTPVSHGFSTSHTYEKPGTYTVELTIIYTDGTQQSKKKKFEVVDSL